MDGTQVHRLYEEFGRPLHEDAALSAAPDEVRHRLCRHLWLAMIAGPLAEEEAWGVLSTDYGLRPDQRELIRQCYYRRMRPQIGETDLVRVRERYRDGE